MTTIRVMANDKNLTIISNPVIASGNIETVILHVDFSEEWSGYGKTAEFYQDKEHVYHVGLNTQNECFIPWEAMQTEGFMYFGIFGTKDNMRKSSEVIRYKIKKGCA